MRICFGLHTTDLLFLCKFIFHFRYYCITMCSSRVSNTNRGKNIKILQQHQQHNMVGNRHIFIAYFCIYLPIYYCFVLCMLTFFSFSLLLYYNISVACIYRILHNITTQQQKKKKRVGTIYILIVYFTLFSAFFLLFILLSINIS